MTTDEDPWIAAGAPGESVLVVGADPIGSSVADRITASDVRAADTVSNPDAVVLAVDATRSSDVDSLEPPPIPAAPVRLAVVTVPDRPTVGERGLVETLADRLDAVVLVSGRGVNELATAVATFVSIIQDSGIVNVDLADVETVFRPVSLAALGIETGTIADPVSAVENAFASLPQAVETDPASGVLVDLIGPPQMSVTDVNDAVSAVRGRIGPDAHVIWGGAVDSTLDRTLEIRLVFAGVENVRVAPGDDCPRCGSSLSTYRLDGRAMLSCDSCGFADVSVRLRE